MTSKGLKQIMSGGGGVSDGSKLETPVDKVASNGLAE